MNVDQFSYITFVYFCNFIMNDENKVQIEITMKIIEKHRILSV